ncbi:MAG: toll/interleukin-1 receptor domain-containing protein [Chloroflexi bacterium]|nr:toll/interleukin-1 receptor domain-containing protein [Chloroflexota bacterium]
MRHVFLSYCPTSKPDIELMHRLRRDLRAEDLDVLTDEELVGEAIEFAIVSAGAMIAILTPEAGTSSTVTRHLQLAHDYGVRIFPVLASGEPHDVVPPDLDATFLVDIRTRYVRPIGHDLVPALYAHLDADAQNTSTTQPSASQLATLFGFTLEELELNRSGKLSSRQRSIYRQDARLSFIAALVLGLPALGALVAVVQTGLHCLRVSLGVLSLLLGWLAITLFFATIQYLFGRINWAEGELRRSAEWTRPWIEVGNERIDIPLNIWQRLPTSYPGEFRAYFDPMEDLLSIEPVNENEDP